MNLLTCGILNKIKKNNKTKTSKQTQRTDQLLPEEKGRMGKGGQCIVKE